ncbi:Dynein heavy chain [Trichuris trichiura]|uniref:Dynein heavy chain n=1 Tax=Trichuris trichiura TaxID=36087 RepID=A0A077ZMU5_TRITR|nr:Dynein heavy chain [Trichuris trichiura]
MGLNPEWTEFRLIGFGPSKSYEPHGSDGIGVSIQECNLYINSSETLESPFFKALLQCIKGVWQDVKTSNGILLSLIGYLCGFDPKPLYAELRYNPIEVNVEQSIIDDLMQKHQAQPYEECPINYCNQALMLILLGKRVDQASYTAWAQARVKCFFSINSVEFKGDYVKYIMNVTWATNVNLIYRYSVTARINVLDFILKSSDSMTWCKDIHGYLCEFLQYARIKSIYLIRKYLIHEWERPILADPYLSTDMEHWAAAMRAWEEFPPDKRIFAGLIASDDVFHLLSSNQLQRLTYIAVQVGMHHYPSLKNYKCPPPTDKETCDALVKKYFSPDVHLPEDTTTPRFLMAIRAFLFTPPAKERPSFAKMLLEDIAKAEKLLKEDDKVARDQLAKQRFVANLMLQKERIECPLYKQSQQSATASLTKEEQPEVSQPSKEDNDENCEDETKPSCAPSQTSGQESETTFKSDVQEAVN